MNREYDDDDFDNDSFEDDTDDDFDDDSETVPCPSCGEDVYEDAEHCPHCGQYIVADTRPLAGWPWVLLALGLAGVVATIGYLLFGA